MRQRERQVKQVDAREGTERALTADGQGYFGGMLSSPVGEGGVGVTVGAGNETFYGASLTPVIDNLSPAVGSQGDIITITGQYFSPVALSNKVRFNGAPAKVLSATETELRVEVPELASSGNVTVTLAGKISGARQIENI